MNNISRFYGLKIQKKFYKDFLKEVESSPVSLLKSHTFYKEYRCYEFNIEGESYSLAKFVILTHEKGFIWVPNYRKKKSVMSKLVSRLAL